MSAAHIVRSMDVTQHLLVQKVVESNLSLEDGQPSPKARRGRHLGRASTPRKLPSTSILVGERYSILLQLQQSAIQKANVRPTHRQPSPVCASASSEPLESLSTSNAPTVPESREASIGQAQVAVTAALLDALTAAEPTMFKRRQRLKKARLQLEIPVLDERPATVVQLASDLLSGLFGAKTKLGLPQVVVYFGDEKAANLCAKETTRGGKLAGCQVATLASAIEVPGKAGVVVIVCPSEKQLTLVQQLSVSAGMRPVVLINPSWTVESESKMRPVHVTLVNSFDVVYSFLPLSIQGFLNKSEGAVFRFVAEGNASDCPWYIFSAKDGKMQCVNKVSKRPDVVELENALYQSMAASSPLTRSIKAVRSVFGR